MNTTIPKVAVQIGFVVVFVYQCLKLSQIISQMKRVDSSIFPADHRINFILMIA